MFAVLHCYRPLKEVLAALSRAGVEYVSPVLVKRTYVRHIRKWKESHVPMFPGYVFVEEESLDIWWEMNDRPGKLLASNGEVVMIEDQVVKRYSLGGVLNEWREGTRVVVVSGDYLLREGEIAEVVGGFATIYFDDGAWAIVAVDTIAPISV